MYINMHVFGRIVNILIFKSIAHKILESGKDEIRGQFIINLLHIQVRR